VGGAWSTLQALREQLDRATMDRREREARLELIDFQLREIERVGPKPGEDAELGTVKQVLSSAERIQRLCAESYEALYEGERAMLGSFAAVQKRIAELAAIEPAFTPYLASGESIKSELEDLASFVRDYGNRIDASPEQLQQVEDRLAALERLKRRHGPTLDDVIAKGAVLAGERDLLANAEERSEEVRQRLADAEREYLHHARELSTARRAAATRFASELAALLGTLAMAQTRFEVRFNEGELPAEGWTAHGIDQAEYFISPNPGEDLRPLSRIVSGGELSRVMLALKTLGARCSLGGASRAAGDAPRTLIFDEVDAGIGGQVADVVGARLQDLGSEFQVLCITHLPQIAARASSHLRIVKSVDRGRTMTSVEPLAGEARVDELARMVGGARLTDPVRASARELLAQAGPAAKAKGESESRRRGESEGGRGRRRG
jgi:DNA repair protein RecN (Recombination protein N)